MTLVRIILQLEVVIWLVSGAPLAVGAILGLLSPSAINLLPLFLVFVHLL